MIARLTKIIVFAAALVIFCHAAVAQNQLSGDSNQTTAPTLETIVVTAQKITQKAESVPISLTVIGGPELQQINASQLTDYAGYIPGLQFQPNGEPGAGSISLRGLSLQAGPAMVATYIDGAPFGSSNGWVSAAGHTLDLLPNDIARIEVLRGPQGTLYGADAMGGLIDYVTRQPDLDQFHGLVGGTLEHIAGGDNGGGGHLTANVPLIDGQLAVRGSFAYENSPGYISFPNEYAKNDNGFHEWAGHFVALWRPTPSLSVQITALLQKLTSHNESEITLNPITLEPDVGKYANSQLVPATYHQSLQFYTATITDDFSWASLTSTTSYSRDIVGQVGQLGFPFSTLTGGAETTADPQLRKYTEELRLTSARGGTLSWMLGAFFDRESGHLYESILALNGTMPAPGINPIGQTDAPTTYKEYALFGNATWKITRLLTLTGGVREARNDQDWQQVIYCNPVPAQLLGCPPAASPATSGESVFNYAISPQLQLSPDTMLYLRYATGYRPGGPNTRIAGVPPSVNSDRLKDYELGVKTALLHHTVNIDAAAYLMNWDKIQLTLLNPNIGVSYFANGNTAQAKGLEGAIQYSPLRDLQLLLNGTYMEAYLTAPLPPSAGEIGASGNALPNVPKWSGSFRTTYSHRLNDTWYAAMGAGVQYTGDNRYVAIDNNGNCPFLCLGLPIVPTLSSYYLVDANLEISNASWSINLFTRNLTNKYIYANEFAAPGQAANAVILQPRSFGVTIDRKF